MTYGNCSDTPLVTPLTTLDVVGHEMMHGVTQLVNGLIYQSESGAINESYSDIFGSALEYFYDQQSNKNLFDWTIAEDAFPNAIRSMSNPKAFDQPNTYNGQYWAPTNSSNDYGGVHTNSGIGNYLFYICCTPTSSINDNATTYTTTNVFNILTLAKLFYNTLNGTSGYKKLPHNTTYTTFISHLVHNATQFITNENLNIIFINTINEAARAINVPVINIIPPPINKIRTKILRRPRYIPKKKKILA
jgi:Zn-dependent metalloprotease